MEQYPRAADLRRLLLERCARYCEVTGIGRSVLSEKLVNSPKYLGNLASGKTKMFDVTYDRCMTRLDELFQELDADPSGQTGEAGPPGTAGEEDGAHDDTEQRSGDESSAIPATDRGNRRGTGFRKGRVHGDVPDA